MGLMMGVQRGGPLTVPPQVPVPVRGVYKFPFTCEWPLSPMFPFVPTFAPLQDRPPFAAVTDC